MTLPYRLPEIATGETLSPGFIAKNFRRVQQDLDDSMSRKYVYGSFMLDFSGVGSTTTADALKYRLNVPFTFDIVGIEIEAYSSNANLTSLSFASTVTGFVTQNLTTTVNTLVSTTDNFTCTVSGSTDFGIGFSSTGAFTLDGCHVTVHYRSSRGNSGDAYAGYTFTSLPGSGSPVARAQLNTEFANLAAAVARNNAADKCQRISVYTMRNVSATPPIASQLASTRVPATLRRIVRVDTGVVAGGVGTWNSSINGLTASVTTAAANTLTTNSNSSFVNVQANDTPNNATNDTPLTFGHTAGAFVASLLYGVVYYY